MDLLDFDAGQLYFDEPIDADAMAAVDEAAGLYGDARAESRLLRAYFLEPEHPLVLVALYRYFYYQHRFVDAMRVAERVLKLFAGRLGIPEDWRELEPATLEAGRPASMTMLRFYLLALKGAAYLELRTGDYVSAVCRLQKVIALDDDDRLGARCLLDVAREKTDVRGDVATS